MGLMASTFNPKERDYHSERNTAAAMIDARQRAVVGENEAPPAYGLCQT
jgi:hypothetical protein